MTGRENKRGYWRKIRLIVLTFALFLAALRFGQIRLAESWVPDWRGSQATEVVVLIPSALNEDERELIEDSRSSAFLGDDDASFDKLARWFATEYGRYADREGFKPVTIQTSGPFPVKGRPPPPPRSTADLGFFERYQRSQAFLDFFESERQRRAIVAENMIFVYFYHLSEARSYEGVHSVADRRSRRGFVFAPLIRQSAELVMINVAHELLHLFGATDKYEGRRCRFPEGFIDPHREPRTPQEFAEVMAQGLPMAPGRERTVKFFDELRVGVRTAAEVNWIASERADRYYAGEAELGPRQDP